MDKALIERFETKRAKMYAEYKKDMLLGFLTLIILIGFYFFYRAEKIRREFRQKFKQDFVSSIINSVFDEATYLPYQGIPVNTINAVGMTKRPDRSYSEDYIRGNYKGVHFESSDIKFEERVQTRDSKGNVRYHYQTYFKGRWMIFNFERNFGQTIKINEGRFFHSMSTRGMKKADVESIAFNKKFQMYTTDQQTVFYILTPPVIEKLMELESMHRGSICYCFTNNQLHIGVNDSHDYFEIKWRKPITDAVAEEIVSQVEIISAVINELKLDSNKFKARA